MNLCECGCGQTPRGNNRFINGHSMRGKHPSPETIEKLRLAASNITAETREKMRVARLGYSPSPETKEKIRLCLLGKPHSPEAIEKLRLAMQGEGNPMYGKHFTPGHKEKIRIKAVNRKPNKCTDIEIIMSQYLDNTGIKHEDQKPLENIARVDHFLPEYNLIIEDDGWFHTLKKMKEHDEERDNKLRQLGYKIIRIWKEDIKNGKYKQIIDDCLSNIKRGIVW